MTQQQDIKAVRPEGTTLARPAAKFHLDNNDALAELWSQRQQWREERLRLEKLEKAFDRKLAEAMGDAGEIWYRNAQLAGFTNDGTFQKTKFQEEQPELFEECSVWIRQFDLEVLKEKHPQVYAAYRARTMRILDNPGIA